MKGQNSAIPQSRNSAMDLDTAYSQLLSWCREHDFAGHDPFDALNSKLFQSTPLARSRNARFVWTQLIKRSPSDFRSLSLVPPQRNSKGIALFALALLANHRRMKTAASEAQARALLQDLTSMQLDGYCGAAWGYNFDWQRSFDFANRSCSPTQHHSNHPTA